MSESDPVSIAGKVIAVTGATRGLGEAHVRYLAARGATVVAAGRSEQALEAIAADLRSQGAVIEIVVGDVRDPAHAQQIVATAVNRHGRLDGLINNAGVETTGLPWEQDADHVRDTIEINVLGTIHCGTEALRVMADQGEGSVVNTTSGAHMGLARMSVYGASKGAIASLTHCWALDMAGTAVRCNAVSPLAVTDMYRANAAAEGLEGDRLEEALSRVPSAAANSPLYAYLLSDAAQAVNGQVFRSDGAGITLVSHPALMPTTVAPGGMEIADIAAAVTEISGEFEQLGLKRAAASGSTVVKRGL